jgi:hypothetical protein
MAETQVKIEDIIPDLESDDVREQVETRSGGKGKNFMGWEDYGKYRFALKEWKLEVGEKENKAYYATLKILESNNPAWPVGSMPVFQFPFGRPGTSTFPTRPAVDKGNINHFIRCIFKVSKDDPDPQENKKSERLRKLGAIESDDFQALLTCKPGKTKKVFDKKTETVIDRTFRNDYFDAVPE